MSIRERVGRFNRSLAGIALATAVVVSPVVVAPAYADGEMKAEAVIAVGDEPLGVAYGLDGTRAYVANSKSFTVSVIDTASNTVVDTVLVGRRPTAVAVNSVNGEVYVTLRISNYVAVINPADNSVVDKIPVGKGPKGIAVEASGARAYVVNVDDGTVSVIDIASRSVTDTITVGKSPTGVAVRLDGMRVLVTNRESTTLSVIDTATAKVVDQVEVGEGATDVAFTIGAHQGYAFVANPDEELLLVVDAESNMPIADLHLASPGGVRAAIASPNGRHVFVIHHDSGVFRVLDADSQNTLATVQVGEGLEGIAVSPDASRAIVTNSRTNTATVLVL